MSRLLIISLVLCLGCQSPKKSEPGASATKGTSDTVAASQPTSAPQLVVSMQNLKMTLEKMLPLLIDTEQFSSADKQAGIANDIVTLKEIASKVSHNPIKQKMDPSFAFLSEGFTEEINRAHDAFSTGKKEYARYSLMNVTAYCIECHTRTSSGPTFSSTTATEGLSKLKPLERGEYLLAVREFNSALTEFLKVLESKHERFQFLEFDRALRYSLAITVKFMADPAKTETVIKRILQAEHVPYYLKQASLSWTNAVTEWKEEVRRDGKKKFSTNDRLNRAEALIKKGRQAQVGVSERSGDVYLLRGLSILHQILLSNLDKAQLGKALFLTGQAYEAVRDLALWSLHESYYESCIRRVPHSNWAMACHRSLEESLVIGFTGSSGTKLPYDVQVRLTELEKLAKPLVVK